MRASLCICACCAVLRSIRDQLGRGSLIERSTPTHLPQKQAHTNVVIIIIVIIIIITKIITITISHHITSRSSSILNDQWTPPTEAGILQYNQVVIIIIIVVVTIIIFFHCLRVYWPSLFSWKIKLDILVFAPQSLLYLPRKLRPWSPEKCLTNLHHFHQH